MLMNDSKGTPWNRKGDHKCNGRRSWGSAHKWVLSRNWELLQQHSDSNTTLSTFHSSVMTWSRQLRLLQSKQLANRRKQYLVHLVVEGGVQRAHFLRFQASCQNFGSLKELSKLCKEEKLDDALQIVDSIDQRGSPLPTEILHFLLLECTRKRNLSVGRQIYSLLVSCGLDSLSLWGDHLIHLFVSCWSLLEANHVFNQVLKPTVYTWNAIISAHVKFEDGESALRLYYKMLVDGIKSDKVTYLWVIKACRHIGDIGIGRLIYDHISRSAIQSDVVGNTLVDMFAKCGSLGEARKVFDILHSRDTVSFGAMIGGYTHNGNGLHALKLFEKMQQEGIMPDRVILLCILKACGSIGAIWEGKLVHEVVIRNGLETDIALGSTLVDMYAKYGRMEESEKLFNELPYRNVVSWGAIIGGFANQGLVFTVFELYDNMQEEGISADRVIFLCVLKACGSIGALEQGQLVDEHIRKSGLELDVVLGSTIVDMYAKCGNLEEAYKVLMDMPNRNVVSWGAIIAGYATYGKSKMAGQCLHDMQQQGLKPDQTIFTHLLTSCSHAGLLEEGCGYFNSMVLHHGITPSVVHYTCMVDLLGRAGCLDEAKYLLQTMPTLPDIIVWRSLLTGCKVYSNVELGKQCFNQLMQLNANDAAAYLLMSNIYANSHMWEDVDKLQEMRIDAKAPKKLGRAWLELNKKVHEFIVGDTVHLHISEICAKLQGLNKITKQRGYVPDLDLVLEPTPDEDEAALVLF